LFGSFIFAACTQNGTDSEASVVKSSAQAKGGIGLEVYGDSSMTADDAIEVGDLLAYMEGKDSVNVKLRGVINACCQKKGCWMDMDLTEEQSMTVRFKDYGFFVPMNSAGRTAVIEGVANVDTQGVDWLRHKAEDAGQSEEEIAAITEPIVSVTFLADGVILE
jgi:hypothetical protein